MGKVVVFFLVALAFQAIHAGVSKNNADDQEQLEDLMVQITIVSDTIADALQKTTNPIQSQEFGLRIEEIIKKLEELKNNKRDEEESIEVVFKSIDEVLSVLKQLNIATDPTTVAMLKTSLATKLRNVAASLELLIETSEEISLNSNILPIFAKYAQGIQVFQDKIMHTVASTTEKHVDHVLQNIIKRIQQVSRELYKQIREAHLSTTRTEPAIREYIRNLAVVTERLERIDKTNDYFKNLHDKLHNVLIFLNKFANHEGVSMENLKILLDEVSMAFEKLFGGEHTHLEDAKQFAEQYVNITSQFNHDVLSYFQPRYERSEQIRYCKNSSDIVKELIDALERISFDDHSVRQDLITIIRQYLENIPEETVAEFEKRVKAILEILNNCRPSLDDIKKAILIFVDNFKNKMDKLPENIVDQFWKQTCKLQVYIDNIVNESGSNEERARDLSLRIRILADLLSSMLQGIANYTNEDLIVQQREFIKSLENTLLKLEKSEAPKDIVSYIKNSISETEKNLNTYKFEKLIQVTTTEVQKLLMVSKKSDGKFNNLVFEYLNLLQWQRYVLLNTYATTHNVEHLSMHIGATTNTVAMYLADIKYTKEFRELFGTLNQIIGQLERNLTPNELKNILSRLRGVVDSFEKSPYETNDFLQKVALQLKTLAWTVSERKDDSHQVVKNALVNYWTKLQKLHLAENFFDGFKIIQTPARENILESEVEAERLSKMLQMVVPEQGRSKIIFQAQRFVQVLQLARFRLTKLNESKQDNRVVKEVRQNIQRILEELEKVVTLPHEDLKIKLSVYVLDTFMEIRKLALEPALREEREIQTFCGKFFFNLKQIGSQVQYNLQTVTEERDLKTLTMQVQSVAHRLSTLLQLLQLKPELKRTIFTQVEVFAHEIGYLLEYVQEIGSDKSLRDINNKLNKIYQTVKDVSRSSSSKSVVELTAFLDTYVQTVVMELEDVTSSEYLQTAAFNEVYRRFLSGLSHIMVRLLNVQYYNRLDFNKLLEEIQKLTKTVTSKLEINFPEDKEIKNDLKVQVLEYTHRLYRIIDYLQREFQTAPKSLTEAVRNLLQLVQNTETSINDLKSKFVMYLKNIAIVIDKEWKNDNPQFNGRTLVEFHVSIEKLFVEVQHIWVRSQHAQTLRQVALHVQSQVHSFGNILELISFDNNNATEILRANYYNLAETIVNVTKKLQEETKSSPKLQQIVNTLTDIKNETNENKIDDLKIALASQTQRISEIFLELVWLQNVLPKPSDFEPVLKSSMKEFLSAIQDMYLEIDTKVVISQKELQLENRHSLENRVHRNLILNKGRLISEHDHEYPDRAHYVPQGLQVPTKLPERHFGRKLVMYDGHAVTTNQKTHKHGNLEHALSQFENNYNTPRLERTIEKGYKGYAPEFVNRDDYEIKTPLNVFDKTKHPVYESTHYSSLDFDRGFETKSPKGAYAINYGFYVEHSKQDHQHDYAPKGTFADSYSLNEPQYTSPKHKTLRSKTADKTKRPSDVEKSYSDFTPAYTSAGHEVSHFERDPFVESYNRYSTEYPTNVYDSNRSKGSYQVKNNYPSQQDNTESHFRSNNLIKSRYLPVQTNNRNRFGDILTPHQEESIALVKENQGIVEETAEYLRNSEINQDFKVYVRELLQLLDNIIDNIEVQEPKDLFVQYVVRHLRSIQDQLKQDSRPNVHGQVQYHLIDAIEHVAFEIERLLRAQFQEGEEASAQFLNFIRKFNNALKGDVSKRYRPNEFYDAFVRTSNPSSSSLPVLDGEMYRRGSSYRSRRGY